MTTYHVLDHLDRQTFQTEDLGTAQRAAEHAKTHKLNGSTVFHVEKRERVYTTSTLEEAIAGTPFDPAFVSDSGDEHRFRSASVDLDTARKARSRDPLGVGAAVRPE